MKLKTRSVMLDQLSEQIYRWTYEEPDRPYFSTFYMEQGALYGLFNGRGMLFRAAVDVDADGQTLALGELEPVMHQFTPVTRSGFTVMRQADGQTRFFMIAGTAILNRVGEIDSTALFDDMIQRAEAYNYYPKLDFYHLGEEDPKFEFGQFDFLAREGVVYVGSGLLDPDHPLSHAMVRAVEQEPSEWGSSIEYYRPEHRGIEYVELGNGVSVVAYTEGLNTRISILPERAAAALFTNVCVEVREMTDAKKAALLKYFGGDEEKYREFMGEKVGAINEEVEKRQMITRSAEATATTTPEPEAKDKPAEGEPVAKLEGEIELDDAAVEAIVNVARAQFEKALTTVVDTLGNIALKLEALGTTQEALNATVSGMQERLGGLEKTDDTKQREWKGDLPAHLRTSTRVTYRPREEAKTDEPVNRSPEAQAAFVLNGLPKVGA